jgi:prostaglandin-E synthase
MTTPNIKWAERKDKLFVTIDLDDVKEPKIDISDNNHLLFSGVSNGKEYKLDLELYGEVDKAQSKWTIDTRNIFLKIIKKTKGPYWNYINKDKKKYNYIHIDWNQYVDEDEEDEKPEFNFPGMDGGNFMDMGGDVPDEDDEDPNKEKLDDLDKAEDK